MDEQEKTCSAKDLSDAINATGEGKCAQVNFAGVVVRAATDIELKRVEMKMKTIAVYRLPYERELLTAANEEMKSFRERLLALILPSEQAEDEKPEDEERIKGVRIV